MLKALAAIFYNSGFREAIINFALVVVIDSIVVVTAANSIELQLYLLVVTCTRSGGNFMLALL